MVKANIELRKAARRAKVPFWAVADRLGISESQISRNLRRELSERDKALYLGLIQQIKREENHDED